MAHSMLRGYSKAYKFSMPWERSTTKGFGKQTSGPLVASTALLLMADRLRSEWKKPASRFMDRDAFLAVHIPCTTINRTPSHDCMELSRYYITQYMWLLGPV